MGQTAEELKWQLEESRADLSRDMEAIGDRVSPGRTMERQRLKARRRWYDVRDRVMGTVEDVEERMGSAGESVGETVGGVPQRIAEKTEGSPMIAGAVAFGLGALIAVALPPTEAERRLVRDHEAELRDAADTVQEAVGEMGRQTAERVKPQAKEAASEMGETARHAAEQVAGQAKESARDVGPTSGAT